MLALISKTNNGVVSMPGSVVRRLNLRSDVSVSRMSSACPPWYRFQFCRSAETGTNATLVGGRAEGHDKDQSLKPGTVF